MSIYRLGSDAWKYILEYLDETNIVQLFCTGDSVLLSRLRPLIRDFKFCFDTRTSPSLSSLLWIFKCASNRPNLFSISVGKCHSKLRFIPERYDAEKWKSLFPETLNTLELALECYSPPFSSLLACLANVAPELKTLHIDSIPKELSLPHSLTKLEFGTPVAQSNSKLFVSHPKLIENLPTTLTHLIMHANLHVESEIVASNIPFQKMPLTVFHGTIAFRSLSKQEASWSVLPNSITDLRAKFTYSNNNELFQYPADPTWTQLFPTLHPLTYRSSAWQKLPLSRASNMRVVRSNRQNKLKKFL